MYPTSVHAMKNGLDCRGSPASKKSERLELCVESTNYDAEPTLHCRTARKRVKIFVPSAAGAPQRQAPIPVLFHTRFCFARRRSRCSIPMVGWWNSGCAARFILNARVLAECMGVSAGTGPSVQTENHSGALLCRPRASSRGMQRRLTFFNQTHVSWPR